MQTPRNSAAVAACLQLWAAAHLGDFGPGVAHTLVRLHQLVLLVVRPALLVNVRPQLVVPPLPQLLADAALELRQQLAPTADAMLLDQPAGQGQSGYAKISLHVILFQGSVAVLVLSPTHISVHESIYPLGLDLLHAFDH